MTKSGKGGEPGPSLPAWSRWDRVGGMIDTLRISKDLAEAGFTIPQAEALAHITTEAIAGSAATKADLAALETKLETRLGLVAGELILVKWMLGTNLVVTIGILWRLLK